jgi:hypothetical protein
MALDKDVLGAAMHTKAKTFDDVAVDTTDPVAMEAYRLNFWKAIADEVIKHFKTNGVIPGTGLVAPSGGGAVTGSAKIQ